MLLAAGGLPDPWMLFVFTAGVWLTRSAISRCATPRPHSFKDRDTTNGRHALLAAQRSRDLLAPRSGTA